MRPRDDRQHNVLLVFADDLGAWALGCAGNSEIQTPVLDELASRGVRFENFFCTSPVCSPARASLLTGRMPSQTGIHDWIRGGNTGPRRIDYIEGYPTLYGALAKNGYDCAVIGKWHLGASDAPRPEFSHWFVHEKGGGNYFGATMYRGTEPEVVPEYLSDAIAADAVSFIASRREETTPFFLNVSFTAPHHPWVDAHPEDLVGLYADCEFADLPAEGIHPDLLVQNPETADAIADPQGSRLGYYAAVTGLDRALGRILDELERSGLANQTLVAFVGDNGFNLGHHGIWGKGNGTYPFNMFDTSVKVPAIFSHPARIRTGDVRSELVSGYDLTPTILDYLGVNWEPDIALPGGSFTHLLEGIAGSNNDSRHEDARKVVVYDEYGPVRMIRTEAYKYVHRFPDGPHELFDLLADPNERVNLIADAALEAEIRQLQAGLDEWFGTYVVAEHDGKSLPVTGLGQNDRASSGGAFVTDLSQDDI